MLLPSCAAGFALLSLLAFKSHATTCICINQRVMCNTNHGHKPVHTRHRLHPLHTLTHKLQSCNCKSTHMVCDGNVRPSVPPGARCGAADHGGSTSITCSIPRVPQIARASRSQEHHHPTHHRDTWGSWWEHIHRIQHLQGTTNSQGILEHHLPTHHRDTGEQLHHPPSSGNTPVSISQPSVRKL